jgi:hypothetical protein
MKLLRRNKLYCEFEILEDRRMLAGDTDGDQPGGELLDEGDQLLNEQEEELRQDDN